MPDTPDRAPLEPPPLDAIAQDGAAQDETAQDDISLDLETRVLEGSLSRHALELLALVEDRAAQRALARLPLELTPPLAPVALGLDLPPHAARWARCAALLAPHGRALCLHVTLAACGKTRGLLAREESGLRAELEGLHTGPWGALRVDSQTAAAISPLAGLASRVERRLEQRIVESSFDAPERPGSLWPEPLARTASRALVARLAGVSLHALSAWAALVNLADAPPQRWAESLAIALTEAQSALGDRGPVADAVRAVLWARLPGLAAT